MHKSPIFRVIALFVVIAVFGGFARWLFNAGVRGAGYTDPDEIILGHSLLGYKHCPSFPLFYVDGFAARNDTVYAVGVCLSFDGAHVIEGNQITRK